MTLRSTSVLTLAVLAAATTAQAAPLDDLKRMWQDGKYSEVVPLLMQYRNDPGGRTWEVDYLIGTSLCRIAGQSGRGAAMLADLPYTHALPDQVQEDVSYEADLCARQSATAQPEMQLVVVPVSGQVASGALVAGKGGYQISRSETGEAKPTLAPVPIDELQRRVFPRERLKEAVDAAKARLPQGWAVEEEGFVIAGRGQDRPHFPPEEIGYCLNRYRETMASQFDMKMPSGLPTVYVARDQQSVKSYAETLHGVALPLGIVAYSVYEDRSLVGMVAADACGSLAHEMVHLAIRQNFGDSPAWLEEGLASEIAVASPTPSKFGFYPSWRDEMLKRHWSLRPSVEKLLDAKWADFVAREPAQAQRVAALHAMAAAFIRYLDAKGKLVPVYSAVRDGRWTANAPLARPVKEIVQEQLGQSLEKIDADFVKWFGY